MKDLKTLSKKDTKDIKNLYYSIFISFLSCRFYRRKIDKKVMKALDDFLTQDTDNKLYSIGTALYNIYIGKVFLNMMEKILNKYKDTAIYKETKKEIKNNEKIKKKKLKN